MKTQREIAAEAGYARPNILSMLKSGETAVSLARIPALAKALETDPAHLFRLAMLDSWPHTASVIDEIFGKQMASKNEFDVFLAKWRATTRNTDPQPNAEIEAAVDAILKKIRQML